MAGKGLRPNKVLDAQCDAERPGKAYHTFQKDLTKRDLNRIEREKKEKQDEINKHVEEHLGEIQHIQNLIVEGYRPVYLHPTKRYMTFKHPDKPWDTVTLTGSDNVSEMVGWIRNYGRNYGIYMLTTFGDEK